MSHLSLFTSDTVSFMVLALFVFSFLSLIFSFFLQFTQRKGAWMYLLSCIVLCCWATAVGSPDSVKPRDVIDLIKFHRNQ